MTFHPYPAACLRATLLALCASLIAALPVHADILISPQRVVLTNTNPQTVLSLHNPGTVERTYNLSWVERRLNEAGQLTDFKDGVNPRSIASMVRFSPRRVMVKPGHTQTVRLSYRPPVGLAPGEYRSHLRIGQEARADGSSGTPAASGEQNGISFQLNALMSFAVPVFVRHGGGTSTARITAVQPIMIKRGEVEEPGLKVSLARDGEFSSYGRLVVYQQQTASAPVEMISEAGGVAMYADISGLTRELTLKPGARLEPGDWIRITYEGEGLERGQVYAERAIQIGK